VLLCFSHPLCHWPGAQGAMVTFDLTDVKTFHKVQCMTEPAEPPSLSLSLLFFLTEWLSSFFRTAWIEDLKKHSPTNIAIILVGNKSDLESKRAVERATAEKFAAGMGIKYFETSAKKSQGVKEAFETLAEEMLTLQYETHTHTLSLFLSFSFFFFFFLFQQSNLSFALHSFVSFRFVF
jgi:GTPase SAR1 family protein